MLKNCMAKAQVDSHKLDPYKKWTPSKTPRLLLRSFWPWNEKRTEFVHILAESSILWRSSPFWGVVHWSIEIAILSMIFKVFFSTIWDFFRRNLLCIPINRGILLLTNLITMIEQTCPESPILSGWPDHSNWDIKLLICGKSPIEFRVQGNSREKKKSLRRAWS